MERELKRRSPPENTEKGLDQSEIDQLVCERDQGENQVEKAPAGPAH